MTADEDVSSLALATRLFSWAMLSLLVAYLSNAVLTISFGLPGPAKVFGDEFSFLALLQLLLYAAGLLLAFWWVTSRKTRSLRSESDAIARFNIYLVRALFFAVLFVGIGDTIISFLRIEELLESVVGEEMTNQLGRSRYRGMHVHMPLIAAGFVVALITRTLGFIWLSILIVAAELLIVITRFVFSYEQAFMGDLVRFWYAALFLFASAYTLVEEGHVRVDVFYATFKSRTKGIINAVGSIFLGMSLCAALKLHSQATGSM